MREIPTYNPDFEEYIRQGEPGQKERAQIWRTAIGLQQVDGLETSQYLKEIARRHIEGDISLKEVKSLIDSYYKTEDARNTTDAEWSAASSKTSTGQVQDKLATSYIEIDNENIIQIVKTIGINRFSIKEIMANMGLKGRDNFLNLYLNPAMDSGFIRMLYPDSPNHPRQKYLLTVKGLGWYNTQHVQ